MRTVAARGVPGEVGRRHLSGGALVREPGGHLSIICGAKNDAPAKHESDPSWASSCSRMAENPFAKFSLERAIALRWTLRDIQARRLKMSPVSEEDLQTLTGLGLVEARDEGLVLTQAGIAVLNGA